MNTTKHVGTVIVANGYYGNTTTLYLCEDQDGTIWGVHTLGYTTFANPAQGIGPLPTLEVIA